MYELNVNIDILVQLIVGVGSTVLALLLMLIKIPQSEYSNKLSSSKTAIVVSFLICGFMMFYTVTKYGDPHIRDWNMFTMLSIYIVVHFSTSIISYSMISLLKTQRHRLQNLYTPGLFVSAVIAFLLIESYKSSNMRYFWFMCIIALISFLIQSITYIVYFDKAYKQSLKDLENYYEEDESHKIKWVRFCYIIAMLTNLFILVYIILYWVMDYKMQIAQIYTSWYLLYMLYLTSNFISFIGSHKLILDAFAHEALTLNPFAGKKNSSDNNEDDKVVLASARDVAKLEDALEEWVKQKKYCEYDKTREEIARELDSTKEILHHYFMVKKNVDFNTWRTELRVSEAKKLLLEKKDVSVNLIGEMSGFSDRSNFHRQFVKIVGCSPKQWRDANSKSTRF